MANYGDYRNLGANPGAEYTFQQASFMTAAQVIVQPQLQEVPDSMNHAKVEDAIVNGPLSNEQVVRLQHDLMQRSAAGWEQETKARKVLQDQLDHYSAMIQAEVDKYLKEVAGQGYANVTAQDVERRKLSRLQLQDAKEVVDLESDSLIKRFTDVRTMDHNGHTNMVARAVSDYTAPLAVFEAQLKPIVAQDKADLERVIAANKAKADLADQAFAQKMQVFQKHAAELQRVYANQRQANQDIHRNNMDHRNLNLKEEQSREEHALQEMQTLISAHLSSEKMKYESDDRRFKSEMELLGKLAEVAGKVVTPTKSCTII